MGSPTPHATGPGAGIRYAEIGVSDAARSLDFYQGLLGLRPVPDPPQAPMPGVHWLAAPGADGADQALIKLAEAPEGSSLGGWEGDDLQRGLRHVGFKVGDVQRQAERLRDAGVTFTLGPLVAVGDVTIAFFRDPDGTLLEIIDGHLTYHTVYDEGLAARERAAAEARPADAGPVVDHVAVTVAELDATLAFYRDRLGCPLIGRLVHGQDPRGFVIDYLQAGPAVLEVFSFAEPTTDPPPGPAGGRLGLRALGVAGLSGEASDTEGVPLQAVEPR